MFYTKEQRNIIDMLFPGMPEYHRVLDSIGDFCERDILPGAKSVDQEGLFPKENLLRTAGKGIFGLPFPREYGGGNYPFPVYIAALEMLAKACANTALHVSIQGMICEGIRLFGSDTQKTRFLKEEGLAEGRRLIAFALTEPCCGSDVRAIRMKAVRSKEGYILNGSKMLITNAGEAEFSLVFAKADKGISAFLVSSRARGFQVMKTIPKLGFRGNQLSAIRLEDCLVPEEDLLGDEGKGLEYAKQILNSGRMTIAAIGVGIAQAAFAKSVFYSKKREAFGEKIANFQLVQEKISDMATAISAARLMTCHAAYLKFRGEDAALQASQAKLFSSEMSQKVCDQAIQIHGGYGYTDAHDVHRHWRDARLLTIGEGTSDMLRLLIAHLALKEG
ncbi:MAG: acyl-CoA dehydrogenase family protein [Nitrospiraceae bacterium]|nr:acyl-CoA dehydrogenase family protein [Nitrospiraceae bacterium]